MRGGRVIELKGCADRAGAMTYARTGTVQGWEQSQLLLVGVSRASRFGVVGWSSHRRPLALDNAA